MVADKNFISNFCERKIHTILKCIRIDLSKSQKRFITNTTFAQTFRSNIDIFLNIFASDRTTEFTDKLIFCSGLIRNEYVYDSHRYVEGSTKTKHNIGFPGFTV